jgi:hypothetical protein
MKSLMISFSLLFSLNSIAAQSYSLFEGASAKALYDSLTGSPVVSIGSTKILNLNAKDGTTLICQKNQCSVANTSYQPTRSTDWDSLLEVVNADAEVLMSAIPELTKKGNLSLGTIGQYGQGTISCSKESSKTTCTLGISYCYQPGC